MADEGEAGHAFISYAPEDEASAGWLQERLESAGIRVWRDIDVLPGEDWRTKIRRAITDDATVFIACFSRSRLFGGPSRQNEALAIEQMRAHLPDESWLIPVRFDDCGVPDWDVGGGRTLESIRSADLFDERREEDVERLLTSVTHILSRPSRRLPVAEVPAAERATTESMSFSRVLQMLRIEAGLSQEELAREAGLSLRLVSDLERGAKRDAGHDTLRPLAEALQLSGVSRAIFEMAAQKVQKGPNGRSTAEIGRKVGGLTVATRTLPRDAVSFTGRERELRELMDTAAMVADSGGVVWIHAIGGMAGIGKTALAVHAAHLLAERFPDGQIFLPLHGHTAGQAVIQPADALASLLETAGVPARQVPHGLEARIRLWRDHLAWKRMLIVLDDAVGHEQVRPLLPGTTGSLVLVTSRKHLTALEDARLLSLDILPEDQAADLLVRLASRTTLNVREAAVAEIVRLCGYLPLAIGMLARQLHHHPVWTASDLAAELATARDPLDLMQAENQSVVAAFGLSYQDLGQELQGFFRRLGLHPGTDVDAYAAAALAGISLARARHALRSLYDQHLHAAGDSTAAAMSLTTALQLCRAEGDELIRAAALDHLGTVQHSLGELVAAHGNLAGALAMWRAIGNKHGEALALEHLGLLRQTEGRVKEAADLLTEALELYRVIGSSHEQERAYNCLAELASSDKD
jgi:transcriptional regulator with XRE-family HTH domain/tetratricopeptide (TPR) repeat protein